MRETGPVLLGCCCGGGGDGAEGAEPELRDRLRGDLSGDLRLGVSGRPEEGAGLAPTPLYGRHVAGTVTRPSSWGERLTWPPGPGSEYPTDAAVAFVAWTALAPPHWEGLPAPAVQRWR